MSQAFYDQLQQQQLDWVATQGFEKIDKHSPLLGMIEELGEFTSALSDHTGDGLPMPVDDMLDAVADFMIFLAHCCSLNGRRLADVASDLSPFWPSNIHVASSVSEIQGRLARCQLKAEQNVRGGTEANVERLFVEAKRALNILVAFTSQHGKTLAGITEQVWENVVSKRTAATQQARSIDGDVAAAPAADAAPAPESTTTAEVQQ